MPADLPARVARVASVRALIGTPDRSVAPLAAGIRAAAHRHFDAHVEPLVAQHWPALARLPFRHKLRIAACDLYASGPYTALLCAPRRPVLVRLVTDVARGVPVPSSMLAQIGRGALGLFGRFAYPREQRRIVLIAAFIAVVDQTLDHAMDDPPLLRGPRLWAVIEGSTPPSTPELALVRALAVAMADGLEGDERVVFEAAMARVKEWIDAEVRAMVGEPDPRGLGHRLAGVEGTIDGLLFPVARYVGEGARAWMYDVSMFVQILDDWFDVELDVAAGRSTPAVEGAWGLPEVEAAWRRTLVGMEGLVRAAGLGAPRYVHFVREAYVLMMHEVMEAMATRPDA